MAYDDVELKQLIAAQPFKVGDRVVYSERDGAPESLARVLKIRRVNGAWPDQSPLTFELTLDGRGRGDYTFSPASRIKRARPVGLTQLVNAYRKQ